MHFWGNLHIRASGPVNLPRQMPNPRLCLCSQAMHPQHAQRLAADIVGEFGNGGAANQLHGLASLGTSGSYKVERDLHSWLRGAFDLHLMPCHVKIKALDQDGRPCEVDHPILKPVEVVQQMSAAGLGVLKECMLGARGDVAMREYWEHSNDFDWFREHPHKPPEHMRCKSIPVWIHGDCARAFNMQKILILSWMSGLMSGCSWSSRMLFTVIPADDLPDLTLQSLLGHFADEINALQESTSLPYRFVYAGSKGDLEWHAVAYQMVRYYRCNLLCYRCFASQTQSDLLWTDLSDDAPWTRTTVRTGDFLNNYTTAPSLCKIHGWSADTLLWDMMHVLFLGIGPDLCGSAMLLLVVTNYFSNSNNVDDHLALMHQRFKVWRTKHRVHVYVDKFTHKKLKCPQERSRCNQYKGWPELDCKAAHVKCTIFFLADLFYVASVLPQQEIKDAASCLHALAEFIWVLSRADFWLLPWEADSAMFHGMKFLVIYRHLAQAAENARTSRWRTRPKTHYYHHALKFMQHTKMNVLKSTCFLDEDFMGKVKRLASKTHRSLVSVRTLQRYVILLGCRWRRLRKSVGLHAAHRERRRLRQ